MSSKELIDAESSCRVNRSLTSSVRLVLRRSGTAKLTRLK